MASIERFQFNAVERGALLHAVALTEHAARLSEDKRSVDAAVRLRALLLKRDWTISLGVGDALFLRSSVEGALASPGDFEGELKSLLGRLEVHVGGLVHANGGE